MARPFALLMTFEGILPLSIACEKIKSSGCDLLTDEAFEDTGTLFALFSKVCCLEKAHIGNW